MIGARRAGPRQDDLRRGRQGTHAGAVARALGFPREALSARVKELSGGQQRRLQLLLVLLSEPNVMILDEPSNDVDTDMLAAMEDLLDSWPGTLIVVSHDRYLLERVTDQQYAIIDGRFRHVPGGWRSTRARRAAGADAVAVATRAGASDVVAAEAPAGGAGPTGADERSTRKEINAIERRLAKCSRSGSRRSMPTWRRMTRATTRGWPGSLRNCAGSRSKPSSWKSGGSNCPRRLLDFYVPSHSREAVVE